MEDLVISLIISLVVVVSLKVALFYLRKKQSDKSEDSSSSGKFTMEIYILLTAIIYMVLNSSTFSF